MYLPERATPQVLVVGNEPADTNRYVRWLGANHEVRVVTVAEQEGGLPTPKDRVGVVVVDGRSTELTCSRVLAWRRAGDFDSRVAMVTPDVPRFDAVAAGLDAVLVSPENPRALRETIETLVSRAEYDAVLETHYELLERRARLEDTARRSELVDTLAYTALASQIESLRGWLTEASEGVEPDRTDRATF